MKVVTPFRPFAAESPSHRKLGVFDWIGAIDMLRHSVSVSNPGTTVYCITNEDLVLPLALRYPAQQQRLMLWILEVSLAYIESDDFSEDTILVSPDMLVCGDLGRWWGDYDAGFLWRGDDPKHADDKPGRKILNGVQFWRHAGKERLIKFYRGVNEIAEGLSEKLKAWGADTAAIEIALAPMEQGLISRGGIDAAMIPYERVIQYMPLFPDPLGKWRPTRIVDFKNQRKLDMRNSFDMLFKPNEVGGLAFPAGDRFMASQTSLKTGQYQRSHLDAALSHVKKFRTAIDGGAHVGTWSIPMAARFKRVLSFEPSLDTFEALAKNIAKHDAVTVTAFNKALGALSKRCRMTIEGFDRAISLGNLGARFVAAGDDVDVVTIDSLGLTDLDFLKLDVEGSEVAALKGAKETLSRCRPVVLFEDKGLWNRYGDARRAPQQILGSLGAHEVQRVSMDVIWTW